MQDLLRQGLDLFLHLGDHLERLVAEYGTLTYVLLFLVIFAETGLVVTPFLPGDSLLFAAGALAARPEAGLNIWVLMITLLIAGVLGDTVNYHIGQALGLRVFSGHFFKGWLSPLNKVVKPEYLAKTQDFYARYGGKTIIIARFVPIVRTFAPFVAGVGTMAYRRFIVYNVTGAIAWVGICLFAGYFFGNIPVVRDNFELVVIGIILFSLLPAVIEIVRARNRRASTPA